MKPTWKKAEEKTMFMLVKFDWSSKQEGQKGKKQPVVLMWSGRS